MLPWEPGNLVSKAFDSATEFATVDLKISHLSLFPSGAAFFSYSNVVMLLMCASFW
jgi:hypothetical protein